MMNSAKIQSVKANAIYGGAICITALVGMIVFAYMMVSVAYPHNVPAFMKAGFASFLILHIMGTIILLSAAIDMFSDEVPKNVRKEQNDGQS